MIYVIIFMLLSQLIYWGLLRFNQVNTARYVNFQDYYTTKIQELMINKLVSINDDNDPKELESHINRELVQKFETHSISTIEEWLDYSNQLGIAYEVVDEYEQIHIFIQEVFLPKDLSIYSDYFSIFSSSGIINNKNALERYDAKTLEENNANYRDLQSEYGALKESLMGQSFRLIHHDSYRLPIKWTFKDIPPIKIQTNHGTTTYSRVNGSKKLDTILSTRNFNRLMESPIPKTNYAIYWSEYIFERELDD